MKNLLLILLTIFSSASTADSFLGLNAGDRLPIDARADHLLKPNFYEIQPRYPTGHFYKYFGKYVGNIGLCEISGINNIAPKFLQSHIEQALEYFSEKYGKPSNKKVSPPYNYAYGWVLKDGTDIILLSSISEESYKIAGYNYAGILYLSYRFPNYKQCENLENI